MTNYQTLSVERDRQVVGNTLDVCLGIDVGTVAVKIAVFGVKDSQILRDYFFAQQNGDFYLLSQGDKHFLLSRSHLTKGEPLEAVKSLLNHFHKVYPKLNIVSWCATGVGSKILKLVYNIPVENDLKSVAYGVAALVPTARTVLELGGESTRYMRIEVRENGQKFPFLVRVLDYMKNGDCAAGTGTFIEQQAKRLKYSVDEIGEVVLQADKSALIAGRCSVFAKTDMIHAQQKGYKPSAILRGLCEAVVRNFKSTVCNGKEILPTVVFVGGLALNRGVVEALKQIFNITNEHFVVPPFPDSTGAIGCALLAYNHLGTNYSQSLRVENPSVTNDGIVGSQPNTHSLLDPLSTEQVIFLRHYVRTHSTDITSGPINVCLGVDVGSVTTKLVLIDDNDQILKEIYVKTDGRPIEVVNRGLCEIDEQFGSCIRILSIGTTGSGRELIGELVNADVVIDEITAHKTGALHISKQLQHDPVDTIFEIGGQDSKFICIENGVVVDFSMNEACAAGTGSFLEEQAERLGINIVNEFSDLAFQSKTPVQFGERCTVFIESDINTHIRQGTKKADIVAGLAYSIALNYLNRVVRGRKIGNVIYFQGGTAYNDAVASAFATLLRKRIIVPPHNGVIGAIGVAILSREKVKRLNIDRQKQCRDFKMNIESCVTHQFTCKACSNYCEIQQVRVGQKKTYWGAKCFDKFRKKTKNERKAIIQDLTNYRNQLLLSDYEAEHNSGKPTVGIPQSLLFFSRFPFFRLYFEELGFRLVLSGPSNKEVVDTGVEITASEPCFPIKLAYGHIVSLLKKNVDYIFVPNIIDAESDNSALTSFTCPWTMTLPFVVRCQTTFEQVKQRFLIPTIHFNRGMRTVIKELSSFAKTLGISSVKNRLALQYAFEAQNEFERKIVEKGKEVLGILKDTGQRAIVILGRPYNIYDPTVNLNLAAKLCEYYGINVIPFDFLDIKKQNIHDIHNNMYWHCGKQILQTALAVRDMPNIHLIHITNFKCGPDSYIRHYISLASRKPFLMLQFDGHNNDAGVITRCEAYLHSKGFFN